MKKLLAISTLVLCSVLAFAQQLAFPGAEGYAAYATGGRGGEVVHVTNLNASGAGSLADAVSKPNRIVVFDVGGVIDITGGGITISSNITIAGQTAPGEGITIYGGRVIMSNAKNVIVRYIRMRGGINTNEKKCTLTMDNCDNCIIDHCTISWGRWDNVHITDASNITFSYNIISEGIDPQRFGAITDGTWNWTITHCLWANNKSRNPKMKCALQYVNNVCYNYAMGIIGGHSAADHYQDVINNYFIAGPSTGTNKYFDDWTATDHLYSSGNYTDGNKNGKLDGTLITDYNGATPMANPNFNTTHPLVIETAEEAYKNVALYAGASRVRDSHDLRIIQQLESLGTLGSFIDSEANVGGIGSVAGGSPLKDTDKDGMPDEWEAANGTNPNVADANGDADCNGYTNIEDYVNSLAQKTSYLQAPTSLKAKMKDATTATLTWKNMDAEATKVIIERSEDELVWAEIGSVAGNITTYDATDLVVKKIYSFRIKCANDEKESLYSNVVTVNDEGMTPGGGVPGGQMTFVPYPGKLYRIISYATKPYNSGTTNAGVPKYLTFQSNGTLDATDKFAWDNPALLWKITVDEADPTLFHIQNYSTKTFISGTQIDIDGESKIGSTTEDIAFGINYTKDEVCSQSGTMEPLAMFRINSPAAKNQQLRAERFDKWIYGGGTWDRADMVFTLSECDESLVRLYTSTLENAINNAAAILGKAEVGNVTLGYPEEEYEKCEAVLVRARTFYYNIDKETTLQEEVDAVTAELNAAITAFQATRIMTLAGYSTEKPHSIFSYGTISNANTTTAPANEARRYLVATEAADGTSGTLRFRVGLSDQNLENGYNDDIAALPEAQWYITYTGNDNVTVRNAKYGTYMQIAEAMSQTPVDIYPYYAKEDNGKHGFYMQVSADDKHCFNVGTPDSDGLGGTIGIAYPADRTRLRWIFEEVEPAIADGINSSLMTQNSKQTEWYDIRGMKIAAPKANGIYIRRNPQNGKMEKLFQNK